MMIKTLDFLKFFYCKKENNKKYRIITLEVIILEILKAKNLNKKYGKGINEFYAIKNINLTIQKGEFVIITGKSGSGKSTLIHLLSGIDKLDSGEVYINNKNISTLNEKELTKFRRKNIGIIYQNYNLFPQLNVKENILLPAQLDKKHIKTKKFKELVKTLNISKKINNMPNELSGGEQQRTAIGRALINKPKILFADEPTGNLDNKNTEKVINLLKYYNKKYKQTIIMVTHDQTLIKKSNRNIIMSDGKIISDKVFNI